MSIVKSSENNRLGPPPQALMDAIAKLGEETTKAGVMLDMGGLLPTAVGGYRLRQSRGKLIATDGPFAEAKEVIGGFAIFNVQSKEEAIALTMQFMNLHKEHWPEWEGETELRQMFDGEGCPDAQPCSP
jgi:hypothetical protein